jgi:hypothetical protein
VSDFGFDQIQPLTEVDVVRIVRINRGPWVIQRGTCGGLR